jgi:hypothetical protein
LENLIYGSAMLVALLVFVQLFLWAVTAAFRVRDNARMRDFRRMTLLAEAEALRAVTRKRHVDQVNLRG